MAYARRVAMGFDVSVLGPEYAKAVELVKQLQSMSPEQYKAWLAKNFPGKYIDPTVVALDAAGQPCFANILELYREPTLARGYFRLTLWIVDKNNPEGAFHEAGTYTSHETIDAAVREVLPRDGATILYYIRDERRNEATQYGPETYTGTWIVTGQTASQMIQFPEARYPRTSVLQTGYCWPWETGCKEEFRTVVETPNPKKSTGPCCAQRTTYVKPTNHQHVEKTWWGGKETVTDPYPGPCYCWPELDCPLPDEVFAAEATQPARLLAEEAAAPKKVPPPPIGRPAPPSPLLKQWAAEREKLKSLPKPSGGLAPDTGSGSKFPWVPVGIGAAAVAGLGLLWWAGRKS